MTTQFAIHSIDVDLPLLGQKRLQLTDTADRTSRSTVLIGRNGTGKSTILRELVMTFRSYFASKALRSRQGLGRISQIEITCDGELARLNVKADASAFRVEREQLRRQMRGPTRLIALSFTPFDKFPPSDDTRRAGSSGTEPPFYVYLGFKSDFRLSPRTRLLRSIDQLAFASSTPLSDQRVVDAFDAIGYHPIIRVTYEVNSMLPGGARQALLDRTPHLTTLIEQLRTYGRETRKGGGIELSYEIDFLAGRRDTTMPISFEELRTLARENILRLTSVVLNKIDEGPIELLELSSGELNLLSGFLGLAAFLEDGCLVLIDEPENSLHPEWQLRYVEMLEAVLRQHEGCHYIIATHSPLIVSGVAEGNAKVLRLDAEPIELAAKPFQTHRPTRPF